MIVASYCNGHAVTGLVLHNFVLLLAWRQVPFVYTFVLI